MTRIAYSLVNPELLERLWPIVRGDPVDFGDGRFQVKIESPLIADRDHGRQVETIQNADGSFRFRREDYGYET